MNKKTTIEDIGGMLDKFILDSKAKTADYFDATKHVLEQPESGTKDQT